MHFPRREGLDEREWERRITPYEHARDRELQRSVKRNDLDGVVIIWYRTAGGVIAQRLGVQPGVADDLPSLLSTLTVEIAWPGAPPMVDTSAGSPDRAVAVWARVWQVREQADLRLFLRWDAQGECRGDADLHPLAGSPQTLKTGKALFSLLNQVAVRPRVSVSPHGLLLAGNRAMEAGDYAAARACYEQALVDLPQHPEAHRNLALTLARLGEWNSAADEIRQAWALAPRDLITEQEYLALETDAGILAVKEGDLNGGATHFLRILEHWPEEPTALVNLGNIRLREGRIPEARAVFQRFLRLHPQHAVAKEIRLALQKLRETE